MKTGRYWFVLTLLFLVGCSSNEGKITGQWLFVGSDPASQQKWTQAKPILVFNDDQSFSWSRTDENGESQTIDGQYSLRPRNWVYMKSETATSDWNWEKGANETVLIAGSTLKIFLSKDETQFLIFQKSNGIDVPLAGEKSVGTSASGTGANAVSSTSPTSPPKSNSSANSSQTTASSRPSDSRSPNPVGQTPTASSRPSDSRSPNPVGQTPTAPAPDLSNSARTPSQTSERPAPSSSATQSGSAVSPKTPKQATQTPPKTSATSVSASGQSAASPENRTPTNVERHSKPTFSQKSDLLDSIVPRDNFVAGYWRKSGSDLIVPPTDFACLSLPAELPESYQLSLNVERLSGFGAFYIGLIVADRPVVLRLIDDPLSSEKSGFDFASGKATSQTEFSTKIFEENKPASIDCVVEKNKVRIIINGNETSNWSGDVGDFVFDSERWKNVPSRRCFLAAQGLSDFRIGKIEILQ